MVGVALSCSLNSLNAADTKEVKRISLPTIVVTPAAYPTEIDSITDTTQVYTSEQLESLGVESLEDALNLFAPLSYGDAGGVPSVFVRGMASGQYKFLIDGVDLKDSMSTNGAAYIPGVLISDIERIEVVSGTKGTLYGSEAMAGVVHVITKKSTGLSIGINAGESKYAAALSGGIDADGYRLRTSVTHDLDKSLTRVHNSSEKDLNEITNVSLSIGKQFGVVNTDIAYRVNNLNQDLDSTFGGVDDPNFNSNSKQELISVKVDSPIGLNTNSSILYTRSSLIRETDNTVDSTDTVNTEDTRYEGLIEKIELRNHVLINDNWTMGFGLDAKTEYGEYKDTRDYGFGESTDQLSEQVQNMYGAYVQESWGYKLFSIKAGGRLESYSDSKTVNTYSFTAAQFVPDFNVDLIFNYRTGYREPTLYERFNANAFVQGKADLNAETSESRELTIAKTIKLARLSVTYFENDVENLITTVSDYDPDVFVYESQYLNSTELARSYGGELTLKVKPIGKMQFLNISWVKTRSRTGDSKNLKIPEERVTLATAFRCNQMTWGTSVSHVGEQFSSTGVTLPKYTVVNTNFSYQLTPKSSAYFGVYNLGNSQYEAVKGIETADRNYKVGYKQSF
jgi:vitamin B12 transporter